MRFNLICPAILGIDEHSFSKRHKYSTTFCDLKSRKVFDVALGKSSTELSGFMDKLIGRDKVKVVCMDLSQTYRSIVKKYFPNAQIVTDRFHVIRLIIYHILESIKSIDQEIKGNRGMIMMLRKNNCNLTNLQRNKLMKYLDNNKAVKAIYEFKEEMVELMNNKSKTKKQCKVLIRQFLELMDKLKLNPFDNCRKLYNTLLSWQEEIVRMWRFTRSNGITEGFHRKMKLIQRRAFGFRNFDNYRKKLK